MLAKVLEDAFKARLQMTMDHTQSGGSSVNSTDYLNRLDETERDRKLVVPLLYFNLA